MILDFTTDNVNRGLNFIKSKLGKTPEYLEDPNMEKIASLQSFIFADDVNRLYPMNSK